MNIEITREAVGRRIGMRTRWEDCLKHGHTLYDDGALWYCLICHFCTDMSFVVHSRTVLNRAMKKYSDQQMAT